MSRWGIAHCALALATLLVVASCGADLEEEPTIGTDYGPRVASARFEGDFMVTDVVLGGRPVTLRAAATVSIETIFGGLTVIPACNTYLGSFTLTEAGLASFTVAGGSSQDCGDLADQEQAILDALAAVDSWTEVDSGFRLDGPDGVSLVLRR